MNITKNGYHKGCHFNKAKYEPIGLPNMIPFKLKVMLHQTRQTDRVSLHITTHHELKAPPKKLDTSLCSMTIGCSNFKRSLVLETATKKSNYSFQAFDKSKYLKIKRLQHVI